MPEEESANTYVSNVVSRCTNIWEEEEKEEEG